jgi:hypothetical protein
VSGFARSLGPQSPLDLGWEELFDQALVVWLEFARIYVLVVLTVQVIGVESEHGFEGLVAMKASAPKKAKKRRRKNKLFLLHEVAIGTLTIPWVKAVVTNHGKALFRKRALIFTNLVKIL